jgi:hypothetical protein
MITQQVANHTGGFGQPHRKHRELGRHDGPDPGIPVPLAR